MRIQGTLKFFSGGFYFICNSEEKPGHIPSYMEHNKFAATNKYFPFIFSYTPDYLLSSFLRSYAFRLSVIKLTVFLAGGSKCMQ